MLVCVWVCVYTCVCTCMCAGVYILACVCTLMCAGMYMLVCVHMWRPQNNSACCFSGGVNFFFLLGQGLSLIWSCPQASLGSWWGTGIHLSGTPQHAGYTCARPRSTLLTWFLGIEHKHCTNWTISPAPTMTVVLRKRRHTRLSVSISFGAAVYLKGYWDSFYCGCAWFSQSA